MLAESIAFYKGESREASQASSRLHRLVVTLVRRIQWQAGLELWKHIYVYATALLPALWMAPRYFAGAIEFGVITQVNTRKRKVTCRATLWELHAAAVWVFAHIYQRSHCNPRLSLNLPYDICSLLQQCNCQAKQCRSLTLKSIGHAA